MNITKKDINALNAELSITLSPSDYETKVENAIKKVAAKATLPGFRVGKVPVSLVKKQYGKGILVEEINKILNSTLQSYITENNIDLPTSFILSQFIKSTVRVDKQTIK